MTEASIISCVVQGLRMPNAHVLRILSHAVKNLASGKFLKLIIPFCTFFKKCVSFRPGRTGQNILSKSISLGISLEAPEKPSKGGFVNIV